MIIFFKKIPPSISVPGFYFFYISVLLIRFLFYSVYGFIVLSACFYAYMKFFTQLNPMTGSELMFWLINLTPDYKVAILSSSVTIAGFVVAFHTATANWRGQMQSQLKSNASGEIEFFFH